MPKCPQCSKPLRDLTRRCPSCQADLDLLVDYVSHLQGGLQRAENLTRAGELGEAVWAYLEVLETDPDNRTAQKQVRRVVTAVRRFDVSTPARRIAAGLDLPDERTWLQRLPLAGICIFLTGMVAGMLVALALTHPPSLATPRVEKDDGPQLKRDDTRLGP